MKKVVLAFMLIVCQPLWAGCESSILEGSHTAISKKGAKLGAWEDAKEMCYPGTATKLNVRCEKVSGEKGVQGKSAKRCVQEVSCNICGEALTRKYEALN
jgi:hypothetical protein